MSNVGILRRIRQAFGTGRTAGAVPLRRWQMEATRRGTINDLNADAHQERRWTAAKNDRTNASHWAKVTGRSINLDLADYLETARARCEYESSVNPELEGVVETHTVDVVGKRGPTFQALTTDKAWAKKAERIVRNFWASPDIAGKLSGAALLRLCNRNQWRKGEYLLQIVTDRTADGPIQTRLLNIDPRRLASPMTHDANTWMGVERDENGKVLRYWILPAETADGQVSLEPQPYPASSIIHGFDVMEDGQARGIPWLLTALQPAADLGDYDVQVMDAARVAANHGVVLYTDHPDAPFVKVNEKVDMERMTMRTAPPGWKPFQVDPKQPSTTYQVFHDETLRKFGRRKQMPLMRIKLDSRDHNYSSARFDSQVYERGIKADHEGYEFTLMSRVTDVVLREAELGGEIERRPEDLQFGWRWEPLPNVDREKEARASTERLANGTSCLRDECDGDWEEITEQRKLEGLPDPAGFLNETSVRPPPADSSDGAENKKSDQAEPKAAA